MMTTRTIATMRETTTTCPVHQSTSSSPTLPVNTHWREVVAQADDGVVAIIDGVVAIIVRSGNRFRQSVTHP